MNFKYQSSFVWIYVLCFFLFLLLGVFFLVLFCKEEVRTYQMLPFVVGGKDEVMGIVSSLELEWLEKNKYLLVDGEKKSFTISSVDRKVMKNKSGWQHQIVIHLEVSNYEINDSILIGLLQQKKSFSSLFFHIWKGES